VIELAGATKGPTRKVRPTARDPTFLIGNLAAFASRHAAYTAMQVRHPAQADGEPVSHFSAPAGANLEKEHFARARNCTLLMKPAKHLQLVSEGKAFGLCVDMN